MPEALEGTLGMKKTRTYQRWCWHAGIKTNQAHGYLCPKNVQRIRQGLAQIGPAVDVRNTATFSCLLMPSGVVPRAAECRRMEARMEHARTRTTAQSSAAGDKRVSRTARKLRVGIVSEVAGWNRLASGTGWQAEPPRSNANDARATNQKNSR